MSEEVILQELITQNRLLQAENEQLKQEIKLLKQKVDLLIRRLFGSKSERLDPAQLELLLKDLDLGKALASAEKAEATPNVEALKPVARAFAKKQRRVRWPKDLAIEQEVVEPAEVSLGHCLQDQETQEDDEPSAFSCAELGVWQGLACEFATYCAGRLGAQPPTAREELSPSCIDLAREWLDRLVEEFVLGGRYCLS